MNIQEFIETSGILEEYALGTLPENEISGVQCLASTYPEVQAELTLLEQSLEKYTTLYQRTPPTQLKANIFAQMQFSDNTAEEIAEPISTVEPIRIADPIINESEPATYETEAPQGRQVFPAWGLISVAASVLFLLGATWLYSQNNDLKATNADLASRIETIETQNQGQESLLAVYTNPNNRIISLNGLEKSQDSRVTVYWNQQSDEVNIQVNKLPQPAADKQYQLWTIVDGKPMDMGMLDNDFQEKLIAMKTVKGSPVAFAITLEKAGGSPTPTMEEMYVMGEV